MFTYKWNLADLKNAEPNGYTVNYWRGNDIHRKLL